MNPDVAEEGIEHLERIETELEEIRKRTGGTTRAFVNGLFQGGGAIIGGVLAILLIGAILAFLGLIPGLGDVAAYIHSAVEELRYAR
ncbi:MAG: hypothetical protein WDN10_04985 [bacterium]